jgi:hypothetical protein
MFGEYETIMMTHIKMTHYEEKKLSFGMHPQLINMNL